MKPDADESILSAYLDDELPPDPRRELEDELACDPGSAEHLAALGKVRDLVAGLPRPSAPCRLSSSVLARVARAESARSRRPVYWVATAASLVSAFVLADRTGLFDGPGRVAAPAPAVAVRDMPAVPAGIDEKAPALVEPAPEVVLAPVEDRDADARRRLEAMLDGPGLARIVVPAGPDGEDTAGRVEGLLRLSARKNPDFVRLAVPPGLVIDAAHPEGAEVLVAVMDDRERREFLARLGGETVVERSADPRLGTMLADLSGLTLGSGPSAAGLIPPPVGARLAAEHPEVKNVAAETMHPIGPFRGDPFAGPHPIVEQADEPDHEFVGPPEPPEARKARSQGPAPVVIWVARAAAER